MTRLILAKDYSSTGEIIKKSIKKFLGEINIKRYGGFFNKKRPPSGGGPS